jgi:hypothetical protein
MNQPVKRCLLILGAAIGFFLLACPLAYSDPIGPTGCQSCNGGIFSLTYSGTPISNDGTNSVYRVTFMLDGRPAGFLSTIISVDSLAVKISASAISMSVVSAPGGAVAWNPTTAGGLNAGGCNGSGSGFNCADKAGGVVIQDQLLYFVFDITVANNVPLLLTESSIKARFLDSAGNKVGELLS